MCEIYAISSEKPVRANHRLQAFFQDSVAHPHGWGLSWYQDGQATLYKEPVRAIDSQLLDDVLSRPIDTALLIAHIRNATKGNMIYDNCHPFVRTDASSRTWVIAHNGTVLKTQLIDRFRDQTVGDTDSEQVAMYLVSRLDAAYAEKGAVLSFAERFAVLAKAVEDLAPHNKLNLALDDGEYLYLHTNTVQPTLYSCEHDGVALFCTRPQDIDDGWQELPKTRLIAYRDGKLICASEDHGHSIDEQTYLRAIADLDPIS